MRASCVRAARARTGGTVEMRTHRLLVDVLSASRVSSTPEFITRCIPHFDSHFRVALRK